MTCLLFDYNNMVVRNALVDRSETVTTDFNNVRYKTLNQIFQMAKKHNADEIIIARDNRFNWRKKFYPEYKAHRKKIKAKEDDGILPWEIVYQYIDDSFDELGKQFPFKMINVKWAEADDCIGVICQAFTEKDKIVVSTDSDYHQLLMYRNVRVYNPTKKDFVKIKNPKRELTKKIIGGEKGDNISAVRTKKQYYKAFVEFVMGKDGGKLNDVKKRLEDSEYAKPFVEEWDTNIENKRISYQIKGVGDKECDKILDNPDYKKEFFSDKNIKKQFLINKKLIDMSLIPEKLKDIILDTYNELNPTKKLDLLRYFVQNKLNPFIDEADSIYTTLQKII